MLPNWERRGNKESVVAKEDLKSLPSCHLLPAADVLLVPTIGSDREGTGGGKPHKPPFVKTSITNCVKAHVSLLLTAQCSEAAADGRLKNLYLD
jgi:hypothetical protein